jgi:nucleotide-binding universal stress UspA family protein
VAGMLAGTRGMPTTVIHIDPEAEPARSEPPTPVDKPSDEEPATPTRRKVMAAAKKPQTKKSRAAKTPRENKAIDEVRDEELKEVIVDVPAPPIAAKAEKVGEALKGAAEQLNTRKKKEQKAETEVDVTTIVHKSPSAQAVALEAQKGYDLLFIGLEKTSARNKDFHPAVTEIAQGFAGPLVLTATRGELDKMPNNDLSILVPVNGTEQARRGAELALVLARATDASITVLYVAPQGADGRRKRSRTRHHENAILKDIVGLAGDHVEVRTAVMANTSADDAILREAERRKHNLVVLGVGRRPGDKLFFGDTAAGLLQDAGCSLLFVAS